ncbi:META domain-containing protein [Rhizobiaceae bacterium BDR2-2]|uniref:META domain-containing protein n=1 Tax=Ectorhizobium quercum TaxID=2965071 RepID=A0AAE3N078_9HYPH|nr:META domain-containing protein [Ectorhizobium quercum]MCX8996930.1 META domain-containing protein [Ectorhizobium quercum]
MKSVLAVCLGLLAASSAVAADVPATLQGRWLAEDIGGGGVVDRLQTTLEISADGTFFGQGGCNRYRGQLTAEGAAIDFGPAAATRMACPPAAMDQEARFFEVLTGAAGFSYDEETRKLTLSDDAGKPLAVLARSDERAQISIAVPGADAVERNQVAYRCGEETVIADYINAGAVSLVTLTRGETFTVAANVIAASGAKYAGDALVWWVNGDDATLFDLTKGEDDPGIPCAPDA